MKDDTGTLKLSAVTLRGIGSYVKGARLEIRPFTVICGTNGSGKSTWFHVLDVLKRSLHSKLFPFHFVYDHGQDDEFYDLTNQSVAYDDHYRNTFSHFNDPPQDIEYGPPGCIGIEIRNVGKEKRLFDTLDQHPDNLQQKRIMELLHNAKTFTVRLGHPREGWDVEDIVMPFRLRDYVELLVDGKSCFRALGRGFGNKRLIKEAETEFLLESPEFPDTVHAILSAEGHFAAASRSYHSFPTVDTANFCVEVIRLILRKALSSIFHLEAMRSKVMTSDVTDESFDLEHSIANRCVGSSGEATLAVFKEFRYNSMQFSGKLPDIREEGFPPVDINTYVSLWLNTLLGIEIWNARAFGKVDWDFAAWLNEYKPDPAMKPVDDSEETMESDGYYHRYPRIFNNSIISNRYNVGASPRFFSSGFHQSFPIIVQLGIMKPGELEKQLFFCKLTAA